MSEAAKDWKSVLAVYARHSHDALVLAQLLDQVREKINRGPTGRREAVAQLELAIDTLYLFSSFDKASRKLFGLAVAGKLSGSQDRKLRELGVKF